MSDHPLLGEFRTFHSISIFDRILVSSRHFHFSLNIPEQWVSLSDRLRLDWRLRDFSFFLVISQEG